MEPSIDLRIEPATVEDVPLLLRMIKGLAEYERLAHEVARSRIAVQHSRTRC